MPTRRKVPSTEDASGSSGATATGQFKPRRRRIRLVILAGALLFAVACLLLFFWARAPYHDCIHNVHLTTYVDGDRSGHRDPGEPPLGGVEYGLTLGEKFITQGVTDGAGKGTMVRIGGCPGGGGGSVEVQVPNGYLATTSIKCVAKSDDELCLFGFKLGDGP